MNKKLDNFERTINNMNQTKIKQQERIISKYERHHHNIEGRVRELERHNQYLETENTNLREDFLIDLRHTP